MLFVLYGTTGTIGSASRQYFRDRGFEMVEKKNYLPASHVLTARHERRKGATLDEVRACDFVYEYPDGTIIGFNKAQIIDAVWGRKHCVIALSTETMDFVEHIKTAYGDFATVVGVFIEGECLSRLYAEMKNITEAELSVRKQIGAFVRKNLSERRALFDDVVIYDGEDGDFNLDALFRQYDSIVKKALQKEKEYRNRNYVPLPYTGSDAYLFVSYAHKDAEKVYPILTRLQLERCRIWFDEGIQAGDNWRKMIASKIESADCKGVLLFISEHAVASFDVEAEINAALALKKKIIPVKLDDAAFDMNVAMYLYPLHHLTYDEHLVAHILSAVDGAVME